MLENLPIQFFDQAVDGDIKVLVVALHKDRFAAEVNIGLGFLFQLIYGKDDVYVYHVIEMTFDLADFA